MKRRLTILMLLVVSALALNAQTGKVVYENNFEKSALGKLSDDFMILDGGFEVKAEGDNKFIELPGAPLETYGVLFGPSEKENVTVTARIRGTSKGRRSPAFAVSLNGISGYRFQVTPSKKSIELFRGDTLKQSAPYAWQSGKWTHLKLSVQRIKDGEWRVEANAWTEGAAQPEKPLIAIDDKEEPLTQRAGIWGNPFAETPIQFDDLKVTADDGFKPSDPAKDIRYKTGK